MTTIVRDYVRAAALFAALALPTLYVVANPTPWSPMGQANTYGQVVDKTPNPGVDLEEFDIPEGWGPATPAAPTAPAEPTREA